MNTLLEQHPQLGMYRLLLEKTPREVRDMTTQDMLGVASAALVSFRPHFVATRRPGHCANDCLRERLRSAESTEIERYPAHLRNARPIS